MKYRYTRALLAFTAVLFVFLFLEDILIISHQRRMLYEEARSHAHHELEIMAASMRESIIRRDYKVVEQVLLHWVADHAEIASVQALAANGFLIASYESPRARGETFEIRQGVLAPDGRELAHIEMTGDLSAVESEISILSFRLTLASVLFTAFMGAVLWFTQRRVAMAPLEREIALRREAEEALKNANELLEERVRERTAELLESEHSYRTLAGNLPGIVYRLTLPAPHTIRFFNNTHEGMTGLNTADMGPDPHEGYLSRIEPSDLHAAKREIRAAIAGDRDFEVEYRFRHADGSVRHFLDRGRPVRDGQAALYIDGVVFDITRSRQNEREVRSLFATLDALVNHIPEGVALLDAEGKIVLANPLGRVYLKQLGGSGVGDTLDHIAGRQISEFLVSPPHLMRHEVEIRGEDGKPVFFEMAARRFGSSMNNHPANGEPAGLVLLLKDITEDRELQSRTRTQERLAAVGQLASGIAHDFSNILTCVIGFSEILLVDKSMPDDSRRQVAAIHESGRRASELITQLLDFSRPTVGVRSPLDLGEALRDFLGFITRILPENIRVSAGSAPGDYMVLGDRTKIQQVIANLAVNARDAMPSGGGLSFSLSTFEFRRGRGAAQPPPLAEMREGQWVVLKVSDTGEGIPAEALPRIFDPFFTTKATGKGTGLGLSQVYGIIKQHEGFITVEPGPGKGATFTIYLPHANAQAEAVKAPPKPAGPETAGPETAGLEDQRGHGEKILVVEDDAAVRGLVASVLTQLGYDCLTARDGEEGLETYLSNAQGIALVLTDIVMPGLDGTAMSRMIRQRNPEALILAMSGYPTERFGLAQGENPPLFTSFLKKPFKARQLADAVGALLRK